MYQVLHVLRVALLVYPCYPKNGERYIHVDRDRETDAEKDSR